MTEKCLQGFSGTVLEAQVTKHSVALLYGKMLGVINQKFIFHNQVQYSGLHVYVFIYATIQVDLKVYVESA